MTPDADLPSPSPAVARTPRTRRDRTTRRSVIVGERVARVLITLGGLGTVAAVATIFGFLAWVVIPLFRGAEVSAGERLQPAPVSALPLAVGTDEYGLLAWSVFQDGTIQVLLRSSGLELERRPLAGEARPTALAVGLDPRASALGFADGTIRTLRIGFRAELLADEALPSALRGMQPGEVRAYEGAAAQSLPDGSVRLQRLEASVGPGVPVAAAPIVRVDRADIASGYAIVTVDDQGRAAVQRIEERTNPFAPGQPPRVSRAGAELAYEGASARELPAFTGVTGAGDNVYLIWADGRLLRFDVRDLEHPALAEALDLVEDPQARVTAFSWLLGRTTLVVGDSTGRVRSWFRKKPADASSVGTTDKSLLVAAHDLGRHPSAVTALAASPRTRLCVVGRADGSVHLVHGTSQREVAQVSVGGPHPVLAVAFAPKEDALLARSDDALTRWGLAPGHPEAGLAALFGKVWYEGFEKPEHVWQSTGGTDDFEPKLGLMPLVFGTLKATLFSMLFAVPIALLAAIFTSEFLHARLRVAVKSVIEMMASLPSVVLGFLAAIVIAPFVQNVVPAVLTSFLVLPALLLLGAHLWQLLPSHVALRLAGWPRLALLVAVFPLSILLAGALAPAVEGALFRGDLKRWLNHDISVSDAAAAGAPAPAGADDEARAAHLSDLGAEASGSPAVTVARLSPEQREALRAHHARGAAGGWIYLLLPLCVVAVVVAMARVVNPWIRARSARWSRKRSAWVALAKLCGGAVAAVLLAVLLAHLVTSLGADPRGGFDFATRGEGAVMGRYDKSNALVLGFLMGFAIIPIIYTLAEDALSSVPQQLRLGSLGAGATPWQTATRIIIPTAMSGLFSAVMIGLGRAVGETMIVLMAAGNTSIMEFNMFNGMRTLSANIATEMPEAVLGGTHYRVLFLAAFTLFAITFTLNTVAETVRQRFRKRAFQL